MMEVLRGLIVEVATVRERRRTRCSGRAVAWLCWLVSIIDLAAMSTQTARQTRRNHFPIPPEFTDFVSRSADRQEETTPFGRLVFFGNRRTIAR